MVDPQRALGALVRHAVTAAFGPHHAGRDAMVRRSQRADLQVDIALPLAKELGRPPREVAQALVAALPPNDLIERVTLGGPGFLNVALRTAWLEAAATRAVGDARLGVPPVESPERIVIDYSHPNVAKEMHVGHLRSSVIGDALARVLAFRGHTVIRHNHYGDWGTPICMLIELLIEQGAETDDLGELQALYQRATRRCDDEPAFRERARARVVLLQAGDARTVAVWRRLVALSRTYFEDVYRELGVSLTAADERPESSYNDQLGPLADELAAAGLARESDGALCMFPEGSELPLIVRKQDGGFGYAATDLAAIRYRIRELHATRVLYVVGAPQARHLALVFAAAREAGWLAEPVRAYHVAFGSVLGEDRKMLRSRAGAAVRLRALIAEAVARADQALEGEFAPEERARIARAVGVGAIKYADLSCERVNDYVFDLARMVAFKGDAAGYIQYMHARARSILGRAGGWSPGPIRCAAPAERALVLALLRFGGALELVDVRHEPHHLAALLHDSAMSFSDFYEACDVLGADGASRVSRLTLTELAARTLACGLELLGIVAPDRM